ncbi:acyltransferase family protein [Flavobacterium selenitireducens]|uniref:acyltransferase family protein n=1 Tax=Flavobacterium selenitireducens TaxID=2722704 RepID=UPI00168B9707|nr:acyltransferase [Flavobacterium selenitireducens]MBD3582712.1 acyltransferase [Flavobacterium selenitireducens]
MGRTHPQLSDRIFGLDFMRATAISMVLLGHLTWILPKSFDTVNMLFSLLGFVGVEVFFVLSGFLIGRIMFRSFEDPDFNFVSVRRFLKRRWYRTLPNYFLILCVNIVIALGIVGYEIDGIWEYFFFLQNFGNRMPVFFPESWSLSIEEFAYVILPFALLASVAFFKRLNRSSVFLATVLVLYVVFIGTKMVYAINTNHTTLTEWSLYLKGVVIYRIDAILTGVIASWIAINKSRIWRKTQWLAAFIAVFSAMFLLFGASILGIGVGEHPFFWNVLFLPLLSFSIGGMLPLLSSWRKRPYGVGRAITGISKISYAMYLVHYGVVMQLLHHFFLSDWGWTATAAVYFTLTVLISFALYRLFEKPIMDLRDIRSEIDFRS